MKILKLLPVMLFPALALFGCASPSTDRPAAPAAPAVPIVSPEPAIKPQPIDVLKKMAAYLRTLDRFTVRVEKTTELILPTNQRLHADQTMEIAIQKPNRMRVGYLNLSGGRQLFYDGKNFSLFTPEPNVYATAAAAPTIDETLDLLASQYRISLPVTDVLVANPDSRLARNLTSETYVGRTLVRGVVCHHLAFRTPEVDWEIWIEDGPKPLPRRLTLTDKSVKGSPQMTANLSDWDLAPSFSADYFTFKPPRDAEKIKFLDAAPAARPAKAVK
ncbi:MAG: DUF2092 domain-containing protein [Candidatus Contendobacter sp.]|nr:DUF2092 domain-containing protein [Candidatus Contendobacter sp.]MDS4060392.1 DUF2092 domain-containing protein [Candidatus Contendobacter sp.]